MNRRNFLPEAKTNIKSLTEIGWEPSNRRWYWLLVSEVKKIHLKVRENAGRLLGTA